MFDHLLLSQPGVQSWGCADEPEGEAVTQQAVQSGGKSTGPAPHQGELVCSGCHLSPDPRRQDHQVGSGRLAGAPLVWRGHPGLKGAAGDRWGYGD